MLVFRPGFLCCATCGILTDTSFANIGELDQYCAGHAPKEGRTPEQQSLYLSHLVNPRTWSGTYDRTH